jgi:hypothetical protein
MATPAPSQTLLLRHVRSLKRKLAQLEAVVAGQGDSLGNHDDTSCESTPSSTPALGQFIQATFAEMSAWKLSSNDILSLPFGVLGPAAFARRWFGVNGRGPVELTLKEFIVLRILIDHRLRATRSQPAETPAQMGFVSMPTLLAAIEETLKNGIAAGLLPSEVWNYPTDLDVRRIISSLREKIRKLGGNPETIESGRRKSGYRISISVHNLLLGNSTTPA